MVCIYQKAVSNYRQNYPHIRIRYNNIAFIGILGFPLYYVIWGYIYTQPYENMPLRLVGAFLCAIILIENKIPVKLRKYMPLYIYLTTIYCLPFFFFFHVVCQWSQYDMDNFNNDCHNLFNTSSRSYKCYNYFFNRPLTWYIIIHNDF